MQDVLSGAASLKRRRADDVIYTVGTTAGLQRRVCIHGFLGNYPTSKPTLDRMISHKAAGLPGYGPTDSPAANEQQSVSERIDRVKEKTLSAIGWWLGSLMPRWLLRRSPTRTS
eukprot:4782002-Pleurochrysis_carterae.AAC.1